MINTIITDFDGTLVDTFVANLHAYQRAFAEVGLSISADEYKACFGLRFDRFMSAVGVDDEKIMARIKRVKQLCYPEFFDLLRPNTALVELIASFKAMGGKTALASTASRDNLMNVVNYLGVADNFDLIFAGMDVREGKPSPEIYIKTMAALDAAPETTLIFEDSEVGIQAAKSSGAKCLIVSPIQFGE